MSIEKKSLVSTLKTAKKAHVASAPLAEGDAKATKGVKMAKAAAIRMAKAARLVRLGMPGNHNQILLS